MKTYLCTLILFYLLALAWAADVQGFSSAATAEAASNMPQADLYGDALPSDAIKRFGTTRFRHGGAHSGGIEGLVFSPDGKMIATAGAGSLIGIWEVKTGKLVRRLEAQGDRVTRVAWSHDGNRVAAITTKHEPRTIDDEYATQMWVLGSGQTTTVSRLKAFAARQVMFSQQGQAIRISALGGVIQLWDVDSNTKLAAVDCGNVQVGPVTVSRDGQTIAAASEMGIHLFALQRRKEASVIRLHLTGGGSLAFSPDGSAIAVGDERSGLRVVDVAKAEVVRVLKTREGENYIGNPLFSPDGKVVAAASFDDKAVILWDVASGKMLLRLGIAPDNRTHLAFSPDGECLAAGGEAGVIRTWNTRSGEPIVEYSEAHRSYPNQVMMSPDGRCLVTASGDATVRLWDLRTGRQRVLLEHGSGVRDMTISPDGRWLVASSFDGTIRLWDTATGQEMQRISGHGRFGGPRPVAFTSDGKSIASWGGDMFLQVHEAATGKLVAEHPLRLEENNRSQGRRGSSKGAFSPDARTLVLATDSTFNIFDVASGKEVKCIPKEDGAIVSLSISADGKQMLISAWPKLVSVDFPDGRGLWSAELNHVVRLIDLKTGTLVCKIDVPEGGIGPAALSTSGKAIAVATSVGGPRIRLFDVNTAKEVHVINGLRSEAWSLAFSGDDALLASGLDDTSVLLWNVPKMSRKTSGINAPLIVPDGRTEVALTLVEDLKQRSSTNSTSGDKVPEFKTDENWALVSAAEKILAGTPTDDERLKAVRLKLDALDTLVAIPDERAQKQLKGFLAELSQSDDWRLAQQARRHDLRRDLRTANSTGFEALLRAVGQLVEHWTAVLPESNDIPLARMAGRSIEDYGKAEVAADTYRRFARLFSPQELSEKRKSGKREVDRDCQRYALWCALRAERLVPSEEVTNLVNKMQGFLIRTTPEKVDADLAWSLAEMIEDSGKTGLTAEAYRKFSKYMAASQDPDVQAITKRMQARARFASLVGNRIRIEALTMNGQPYDWSQSTGKVVLVNVWATWCQPCVAEIPHLKDLYRRFHARGFEIVGICPAGDREALEKFLKKSDLPWILLIDRDGSESTLNYYDITSFPTMILVGRDGKVLKTPVSIPTLDSELEKLPSGD